MIAPWISLLGAKIAGIIARSPGCDHIGCGRLDRRKLLICYVLARQFARRSLQGAEDFENLDNFGLRKSDDSRAAIGQEHQEAFRREQLDRFSERRARDPEALAQLDFIDPRHRFEFAFPE
jgi:hypothetical protein